jgi:RimJ/RimL family protein N-acetyltransferase
MRPLPSLDPPPCDGVVALRRWRAADAPALARICRDPEIQRWTLVPAGYDLQDAHDFLARADAGWRDGSFVALAVVAAGDPGAVLGAVGLGSCDRAAGSAEAGYWVAPDARRRGVATGGLRLLTGWAFDTLGLRRLELQVMAGNVASERVARRAGYRRTGTGTSVGKHGRTAVALFSRTAA